MTPTTTEEAVRTTCPYCGVGCGVIATVKGRPAAAARSFKGITVSVRGDPDHPANFGKLCSKGSALGETIGLDGRLLAPEVGGRPVSWNEALDTVAARLSAVLKEHGPDAIGFYVSGQLLTEDYYVVNKLMKGFIGSANIDTNSRLCMASSVAGHKRGFGEDLVPGQYADLEQADLVVLVGSNFAWCHPILHQRLLAARRTRATRIVTIDPRATATSADGDLHLALRPGSDVLLFNGLLAHLAAHGAIDQAWVERATSGLGEAVELAMADAPGIEAVAQGCDLDPADVRRFFEWFTATPRTVTVYSQGVNQSAHGTDKVNAILNCHLITGRVGREGAGPFSITGQPNAMGGREVGGLANQLAAHMGFDDEAAIDRVARFWQAPSIARKAGLKAVDLFAAAADGRVKALWIMGTNPAVSMPDAGRVRRALERCEFVVVSDVTRTDTTRHADVLLPAAAWAEKDGTVTNSERRISRQRAFLPLPGEVRPDWRIVADVATRMGFGSAFGHADAAAVFREHAALSAFENAGGRLFDIGGLAGLDAQAYEALVPTVWPVKARLRQEGGADLAAPEAGYGEPGGRTATGTGQPDAAPLTPADGRLLGDGRFPTADGRARFVAVRQHGPVLAPDRDFPLLLNSGRLRDQWHTMTRTGRVPRLMSNAPEPVCDLHPEDAARIGLAEGDLLRLRSRYGSVRCKAHVSDAQRRGEVFLPMHWSGSFAANAAAGSVANPAVDPFSGQPELKQVPVRIERETVGWSGLFVTRRDLCPTGLVHWSRSAVDGGWVYELSGTEPVREGMVLAQGLIDPAARPSLIEYLDKRGSIFRAAVTDPEGRLAEAILVAPPGRLPSRDWLLALLASGQVLGADDRRALLSGRAPVALPSIGRIVCSCFAVGLNQIQEAVVGGCQSVDAVGRALKAGTNCGSCRSEIKGVIDASRHQPVHA